MRISTTSLPLMAAPFVTAQQSMYGQCGGTGWSGATTCVAGATCVELNPYYSQCQPGTASTFTTSSTAITSTPPKSTPSSSPTKTTGGTTPSTTVSGGAGPGATLQSGYYWIRSVEDPNFHKYLQTDPKYTTGTAIMGDPSTAGQFNIVDGQLVELIDPVKGTLLYATVSPQANASETSLPVAFTTTKNTYGTFAFQGDAVTWSTPSISRPNLSAWYVCTGQSLHINLGNYLYMTPPGCADETIHSYGGATAVD